MGAVAPEESDEEEFEVNEPDFKSHVLENVRVSKEERKKKGKARGKVAADESRAGEAVAAGGSGAGEAAQRAAAPASKRKGAAGGADSSPAKRPKSRAE